VSRLYGGPSQTNLRIDLTYDGNNQIASMTRYSDLTGSTKVAFTTYLYDAANRVTSLIHRKGSDSSNISNYTYTYDPGSRVTTEVKNGTTITYAYDATNQLTADGTKTFTYDGAGNRTNTGYSTGSANQLASDGVWTYTYDAEGNLTKKSKGALAETWSYGYDTRNELTSAKHSATDGGSVNKEVDYKYDPFGNRAETDYYPTGPGGSETITRFSYDGWDPAKSGGIGLSSFDIWADLDGQNSNALLTRYVRDDKVDGLLARIDASGNAYWTLTDRQGTIRDVTNGSGVVKDTITYDGWGQITNDTNMSLRGRYGYTGREEDVETGLQYNRARYYDSVNARWISQDPLGFDAGDSNLYRYVRNRATVSADPNGDVEVTTVDQERAGYGKYEVHWKFELNKKAPADGYLVQKVTFHLEVSIGGMKQRPVDNFFWEAWFVKAGNTLDTDFGQPATEGGKPLKYTDGSSREDFKGSDGHLSSHGEIKFFLKTTTGELGDPGARPRKDPDPSTGWGGTNQHPDSGPLPSTKIPPKWWNQPPANEEPVGKRSVAGWWYNRLPGWCPIPYSSLTVIPVKKGTTGVLSGSP
jgi:RHS repeat-associated protein